MDTFHGNVILKNIEMLCESHVPKISKGKMCTDLGISRSLITKLKNDPERTINGDTAQKIADYFDVSVNRILGTAENEQSSIPAGMELNENQKAAMDIVMQMSDDQLQKFLKMADLFLEQSFSK